MLHHKRRVFIVVMLSLFIMASITISYALKTNDLHDEVNVSNIPPIQSTLNSNRYTQQDDLSVVTENPYVKLDGYDFLGTDPMTDLSLYVHPENLSLRVVNEKTGYIWGSNMNHDYLNEDDPLYDPTNPPTNTYQDNSPVSITYYNMTFTQLFRQTEYFFDGAFSGSFVRENLEDKIGFRARLKMPRSGIQFTLNVYLDEEGLNVTVPFDSINDNGNFLISTITVYRNFGFTVKDTIPGYVFIPDGIGALIRYNEQQNKNYSKRFYGSDLTLQAQDVERPLTASLYGTVQGINQNAMMVILKNGSSHATLAYQSHGTTNIFNRIYISFEYRDKYIQRLNASGTSTIERVQAEKTPFDIHLIYKFLDGDDANYVGMANHYREYLIRENYKLNKVEAKNGIPLHLDVLATENKSVWYGRETFSMTKASDILSWSEELVQLGINRIEATIHGWQKYGASRTSPNYGSFESKFGNPWDLFGKPNLNVYYATTPLLGYQGSSGYQSKDIVQNQGSELILLNDYYLIHPTKAYEILNQHHNKVFYEGARNFSLESMNILYSDHSNGILSRENAIKEIQKLLSISEKTAVSHAFDYLFSADLIKDIDMYSSQKIIFTDTVPFLTTVLSGYKEVFGRNGNFFANTQNELLRMIDYHVYPNFYMTSESAQKLLNTDSSFIFTSKYEDWKDEVVRQYHFVNEALKHVQDASIQSRIVLYPGVVKNTYSNGVTIYVNYSGIDYMIDGINLEMMSYEVVL